MIPQQQESLFHPEQEYQLMSLHSNQRNLKRGGDLYSDRTHPLFQFDRRDLEDLEQKRNLSPSLFIN